MKDSFVIISERDWDRVRPCLFTDDGNENAGVFLCGRAEGDSESRLLVRHFMPVPLEFYRARNGFHLEVLPSFYNQAVDECTRHSLTPVLVHSHPYQKEAVYSPSDDYGEERLLPVLESLVPGSVPASLVISPDGIAARTYSKGRFVCLSGVKVLGRKSRIFSFRSGNDPVSPLYDRQVRAFGAVGQSVLQQLKAGVVGVGGTGSLVVEQLARAGVRDMVLIDADVIEASNISRLYGAQAKDVGRKKVDIIATHARKLGATKVKAIADSAIRQRILLALRDRDIVFSCVDNDRTRAILNRFSHQYLIPSIELGIRLDGRPGHVQGAAGRVVLAGSGLTCLRCSHFLNPERIRAESLSKTEREALEKEGYVMGIDEPAPAVVSLNTVIAGLGVTAALNTFVDLTGAAQPLSQLYDATTGSVFTALDVHQPDCDICDETVGVKAMGDGQIVSAYE